MAKFDADKITLGKAKAVDELPSWYQQFLELDTKDRKKLVSKVLALIQKSNPEGYNFIKNSGAELVGISPRLEYALIEGASDDTDITWLHAFSMPTCLFWCEKGKFAFFINPNLRHNQTVLDKVSGNPKSSLKGFTG